MILHKTIGWVTKMNKSSIGCFIYKWGRIALIVAIIATVIFVFYNSCLSKEESSEQSNAASQVIEALLPDGTAFKEFVLENIRKIAHFTEYGILGTEVALYILIYERKRCKMFAPLSLLVPVLVGFLDESIQVLSERGPSITDVWIDIGGYFAFSILVYIVAGTVFFVKDLLKRKSGAPKK